MAKRSLRRPNVPRLVSVAAQSLRSPRRSVIAALLGGLPGSLLSVHHRAEGPGRRRPQKEGVARGLLVEEPAAPPVAHVLPRVPSVLPPCRLHDLRPGSPRKREPGALKPLNLLSAVLGLGHLPEALLALAALQSVALEVDVHEHQSRQRSHRRSRRRGDQ